MAERSTLPQGLSPAVERVASFLAGLGHSPEPAVAMAANLLSESLPHPLARLTRRHRSLTASPDERDRLASTLQARRVLVEGTLLSLDGDDVREGSVLSAHALCESAHARRPVTLRLGSARAQLDQIRAARVRLINELESIDSVMEAATAPASGEETLQQGVGKGKPHPRVVHLQNRLNMLGHRVAADGKFGEVTTEAVKDFQAKAGMKPTGVVDPETTLALRHGRRVIETGPAALIAPQPADPLKDVGDGNPNRETGNSAGQSPLAPGGQQPLEKDAKPVPASKRVAALVSLLKGLEGLQESEYSPARAQAINRKRVELREAELAQESRWEAESRDSHGAWTDVPIGSKVYAKRHHTTGEPGRVLFGRSLTVQSHKNGVLAAKDDLTGQVHTYNEPAMRDALQRTMPESVREKGLDRAEEAAMTCTECGAAVRGGVCQRGHRLQEAWSQAARDAALIARREHGGGGGIKPFTRADGVFKPGDFGGSFDIDKIRQATPRHIDVNPRGGGGVNVWVPGHHYSSANVHEADGGALGRGPSGKYEVSDADMMPLESTPGDYGGRFPVRYDSPEEALNAAIAHAHKSHIAYDEGIHKSHGGPLVGPVMPKPKPKLTESVELVESPQTAALSVTHAPIGKGGTNWVTKSKPGNTGQLPAYIQNIRNAIMRGGKSESEATAIAVGRCKDWAAGGGGVSAEVKAAAAKAIAEWEAMKGAAHAKSGAKKLAEADTTSDFPETLKCPTCGARASKAAKACPRGHSMSAAKKLAEALMESLTFDHDVEVLLRECAELQETWADFDAQRHKSSWGKLVKSGPMPNNPYMDSPGRGPTGKLRNFEAMSQPKLGATLEALMVHGEDHEAHQAAMHAAGKKLGVRILGKPAPEPKKVHSLISECHCGAPLREGAQVCQRGHRLQEAWSPQARAAAIAAREHNRPAGKFSVGDHVVHDAGGNTGVIAAKTQDAVHVAPDDPSAVDWDSIEHGTHGGVKTLAYGHDAPMGAFKPRPPQALKLRGQA